jgi:mandelamide amidase
VGVELFPGPTSPAGLHEEVRELTAANRPAGARLGGQQGAVPNQGLVIPRKLPGPNNTLVDAKPAYDAAMKTGRPALKKIYADAFRQHKIDALVFPTVPKVAMAANPESSSVPVFMGVIQNTDPGSNAGLPGLQLPIALGAGRRLPIGIELDGPAGSDRHLVAIGLALEPVFGRLPPPAQ